MTEDDTTLTALDRLLRQKPNKETLELSITLDQLDLTLHRTLHPTTTEYALHSFLYETYSKINSNLCYEASLNTFKIIEIIPNTNHRRDIKCPARKRTLYHLQTMGKCYPLTERSGLLLQIQSSAESRN